MNCICKKVSGDCPENGKPTCITSNNEQVIIDLGVELKGERLKVIHLMRSFDRILNFVNQSKREYIHKLETGDL